MVLLQKTALHNEECACCCYKKRPCTIKSTHGVSAGKSSEHRLSIQEKPAAKAKDKSPPTPHVDHKRSK